MNKKETPKIAITNELVAKFFPKGKSQIYFIVGLTVTEGGLQCILTDTSVKVLKKILTEKIKEL